MYTARESKLASNAPSVTTRLPDRNPAPSGPVRLNKDDLLTRARTLPPMPQVVLKVLQLTSQEHIDLRDLAIVIGTDPVFAARLLKLANSAVFALPRAVSAIAEAVSMLGIRQIRQVALVTATHDSLHGAVTGYGLDQGMLWQHSLATGMAARILCDVTGSGDGEEAFVAGLLHDIGKLVLGSYVETALPAIQEFVSSKNATFGEAEKHFLGFDSADVGGLIAKHWNLPLSLVDAIGNHANPGPVPPRLTAITHVANLLSLTLGLGIGSDGLMVTVHESALNTIGLSSDQFDVALDALATKVNASPAMFVMKKIR